jgi:putative PIN family toxin of toxin-antitoxin system
VLDTNVALDLFHWQDPVAAPLLAAAGSGRVELLTDAACFAEFAHVVARPEFGLGAAAAASTTEAYRQLARLHGGESAAGKLPRLPRCRDPDDQKFLELARDAAADLLVTRDKALLALARRKYALAGFRILQPAAAVALIAEPASAPSA